MDLYLGATKYVTFWGNCIWWFYKRALDIAPKKKKYHRPATFCPLRCCSWLTNIWLRIDKFQYGQNPPHPSSRVFLFFWNWRVSNNQKFYFHNFHLCNVILEGKAFPLPSSTVLGKLVLQHFHCALIEMKGTRGQNKCSYFNCNGVQLNSWRCCPQNSWKRFVFSLLC